ncbi:DUF2487 family protein [Halalkalibacillus halophilus]|uniref:DUF2487 family protein n=1 Tax=Halalkalibacillus halophilus TaxID=392827 RepID=UPI000425F54A|nr:DUF2487 family protein [Halalkalibacillus halophilus]
MKWMYQDVQAFQNAKEYIDTAVIPLVPYTFKGEVDIKKFAFQSEVMNIFMSQIEKQLKGRVFLLPSYYYIKTDSLEPHYQQLNETVDHLHNHQFKHVLLFSFDKQWRKFMKDLHGELVWLPAMKEQDLNQVETQQVIQSHIGDIEDLIKEQWKS